MPSIAFELRKKDCSIKLLRDFYLQNNTMAMVLYVAFLLCHRLVTTVPCRWHNNATLLSLQCQSNGKDRMIRIVYMKKIKIVTGFFLIRFKSNSTLCQNPEWSWINLESCGIKITKYPTWNNNTQMIQTKAQVIPDKYLINTKLSV